MKTLLTAFVLLTALQGCASREPVLSTLSPSPDLTLKTLLEDELLLAMPLIPRHVRCESPIERVADQDLPHPFAALAGLKLPKT